MQKIIRPDFIFSYWIFVWFILYFTRIVSINPKLWLLIAFIENIMNTVIIYLKSKMYMVVRFIIITILIKVLPLYYLWNTKIRSIDVFFSIALFVMYLGWLYINNYSIYTIYEMIYNSQTSNSTYIGPLSYLYDKIYKELV